MGLFLILGIVIVTAAASAGYLLPRAPSAIQTNTILQPLGHALITYETQITLVGIGLIIFAVFFSRRHN